MEALYGYLKLLNSLTIAHVALSGENYCSSVKQVNQVLGNQMFSFEVLDFVTFVLLGIVKLVVVAFSLVFSLSVWKIGREKELLDITNSRSAQELITDLWYGNELVLLFVRILSSNPKACAVISYTVCKVATDSMLTASRVILYSYFLDISEQGSYSYSQKSAKYGNEKTNDILAQIYQENNMDYQDASVNKSAGYF